MSFHCFSPHSPGAAEWRQGEQRREVYCCLLSCFVLKVSSHWHNEKKRSQGHFCPLPALPAEQQKPFLRRIKKKQNRNQTKKQSPQKKTPKPPNLSTKPTNGLYRLKNSQQDRTSPRMIHFIAHNPFTLSPSLQYQCCRWALATAAVWPGLNSNSILQLKTRMNCCQRWKIVYLNLPDLFLHRWYQSPVDGLLSTHMNKTQAGAIY